MRVKVRLFARLRELGGSGELVRDVPDNATVSAVWQSLVQEFPGFADYRPSLSCAVNTDARSSRPPSPMATKWPSCRPCPAVRPARGGARAAWRPWPRHLARAVRCTVWTQAAKHPCTLHPCTLHPCTQHPCTPAPRT